ncbi:MAG: type II toxin-antitoxin system Phd/YefM family antitoxin [Lentisphaerae bacterium]|nr:type II toxin-antitoxin system Phd/YefM family antitoxin [Lentisphaerota bacterium]
MLTVNIKDARACLGRLVDKAETGETVVITRRGKKSALLVPLSSHEERLPSLSEFRSSIAAPKTGLAATVIVSRGEERF